MRKHSNSLDWCFDCKQVKGMKSNANKKTRIYLKNHFCSWFVSCFRNKIHKLLIYKWLNSCILNFTDLWRIHFGSPHPAVTEKGRSDAGFHRAAHQIAGPRRPSLWNQPRQTARQRPATAGRRIIHSPYNRLLVTLRRGWNQFICLPTRPRRKKARAQVQFLLDGLAMPWSKIALTPKPPTAEAAGMTLGFRQHLHYSINLPYPFGI